MVKWDFKPNSDPTARARGYYPAASIGPPLFSDPVPAYPTLMGRVCPTEDVTVPVPGQGQLLL